MTTTELAPSCGASVVRAGRRRRAVRRRLVLALLAALSLLLVAVELMSGHTFYTPGEVARVLLGEQVPGASFTVGELRLPRALGLPEGRVVLP